MVRWSSTQISSNVKTSECILKHLIRLLINFYESYKATNFSFGGTNLCPIHTLKEAKSRTTIHDELHKWDLIPLLEFSFQLCAVLSNMYDKNDEHLNEVPFQCKVKGQAVRHYKRSKGAYQSTQGMND